MSCPCSQTFWQATCAQLMGHTCAAMKHQPGGADQLDSQANLTKTTKHFLMGMAMVKTPNKAAVSSIKTDLGNDDRQNLQQKAPTNVAPAQSVDRMSR